MTGYAKTRSNGNSSGKAIGIMPGKVSANGKISAKAEMPAHAGYCTRSDPLAFLAGTLGDRLFPPGRRGKHRKEEPQNKQAREHASN